MPLECWSCNEPAEPNVVAAFCCPSCRGAQPVCPAEHRDAAREPRDGGSELMSSSSRRENGDTMPYLITTVRPPSAPDHSRSGNVIERRAVGSLDGREVWNALYGVEVHDRQGTVDAIAALPYTGGKVGPSLDGTVVEVEMSTWPWLAERAGLGASVLGHMAASGDKAAQDAILAAHGHAKQAA